LSVTTLGILRKENITLDYMDCGSKESVSAKHSSRAWISLLPTLLPTILLETRLRDIEATIQKLTFKMMVDDDFFAPFEYTTPEPEDEVDAGHVGDEQGSSSGIARG
jgi:hypothetical protein